jgi:glycosyltransferase involved in cell wall biosynthesis
MLSLIRRVLPRPYDKPKRSIAVRATLLGSQVTAEFEPRRHARRVSGDGEATLVRIDQEQRLDFTYPQVKTLSAAPARSAFPVEPGARYVFAGSADVLSGSNVRASIVYFDGAYRLDYHSAPLSPAGFARETTAPEGARTAVLAFRVKGPACFAVRDVTLNELVPAGAAANDPSRNVVMIVLNDIVHDGRVLKTTRTLIEHGYSVTLLGMWRNRDATLSVTSIAGASALIFPNPSCFLRDARVRALNWEHTIAYLRACMWSYVERADPRFIHTHDYHTVPLGFEFVRRLRAAGREVHWLHDFHEYVAGYDHMEPDWQDAILAYEDLAVGMMDRRFTVSPMIASWLKQRYRLVEAPTVVLNAPSREALAIRFERTVRRDLGLGDDVVLIVYTGGVSELRGLHTVVAALAANPAWHLALVTNNTGAYIKRLEEMAAGGGYGDRFHLLPYVEPHEVAAYVRDASIGIMPFRRYGNTDASLPNKLYDYLHAGLPMVASNCTLIQEFFETWQVGAIFEEENVRDCAETIARVLARQAFYRDNICRHPGLLRECTWEEQARKILDAYASLESVRAAIV